MAGIRGRNTKIEVAIRKGLFALGYRYRTDVRKLPGRPDIVLPRWKAVVLVHGCFWHSHDCGLCRIPATRPEFWKHKLEGNAERDRRNETALKEAGWRVAIVWECALRGRGPEGLNAAINSLDDWIRGPESMIELRG